MHWRLTYPSLVWHNGILNVDVLLCTPFIDRDIRRLSPGVRRVVAWLSDPVKLLTWEFLNSERAEFPLEPPKLSSALYKDIVRILKQVIFQRYTKTEGSAAPPVSGLSLLEPAQRTQQFCCLHDSPKIKETSKNCTFGILCSSFAAKMQLLPNCMVVAYAVAALAVFLDIPYMQGSRTTQENLNLACPTSTAAAVHYKSIEARHYKNQDLRP